MTFMRVRKGRYLYEETRVREGKRVKSISIYRGIVDGAGEVGAYNGMVDAYFNPPEKSETPTFDQNDFLGETEASKGEAVEGGQDTDGGKGGGEDSGEDNGGSGTGSSL